MGHAQDEPMAPPRLDAWRLFMEDAAHPLPRLQDESRGYVARRFSRKVVPGLPRPGTFKRQQSELRDNLEPVNQKPEGRRTVSVDRKGYGQVENLSKHGASSLRRTAAPTPTKPVELDVEVKEDEEAMNPEVNASCQMSGDHSPDTAPPADDEDISSAGFDELLEELEKKWILNLSMHFRDKSNREKFFVTYAESSSHWHKVTISLDYRNAPEGSLEDELQHMCLRDKSARIYESIRDSLQDIQFYDTVTNLSLRTVNDHLHVYVTEDTHEIIGYDGILNDRHLSTQPDLKSRYNSLLSVLDPDFSPTRSNTVQLDYSNFALGEVNRRGAKRLKRYDFEDWGSPHAWKHRSTRNEPIDMLFQLNSLLGELGLPKFSSWRSLVDKFLKTAEAAFNLRKHKRSWRIPACLSSYSHRLSALLVWYLQIQPSSATGDATDSSQDWAKSPDSGATPFFFEWLFLFIALLVALLTFVAAKRTKKDLLFYGGAMGTSALAYLSFCNDDRTGSLISGTLWCFCLGFTGAYGWILNAKLDLGLFTGIYFIVIALIAVAIDAIITGPLQSGIGFPAALLPSISVSVTICGWCIKGAQHLAKLEKQAAHPGSRV